MTANDLQNTRVYFTVNISSWRINHSYAIAFFLYLLLVHLLRYRRVQKIVRPFTKVGRPLSSMNSKEALDILVQLQTLEFPYAMNKARTVALLKVSILYPPSRGIETDSSQAGGIPTMSKLFAVTGNNTPAKAGKRAVDTEILLREAQTQPRDSERYMTAVARMNYLHRRYRQASKILDEDLLHTLGDGAAEIVHIVNAEEWRRLTDVEKCALGVYHHDLGTDMEIPFTPLKSSQSGWRDGLHFVDELIEWTAEYERRVCRPTETADRYVKAYVDSATWGMPAVTRLIRSIIAVDLDNNMRESLW